MQTNIYMLKKYILNRFNKGFDTFNGEVTGLSVFHLILLYYSSKNKMF